MEAAMDSEARAAAACGDDVRRRGKAARRSVSWATTVGVLPFSSAEDVPSAEA